MPRSTGRSTVLCFSAIFMFAVSGQVFPSVLSQLPGSAVEHGLLLFALFLFFPIASAGAGFVADRIGKKRMLVGGALLMSLTFLISTFVSSIGLWILAVLFLGVGSGVVEGQASAKLADLHPGSESRYLNASQSFYSGGAVIGPFYIYALFKVFPGIRLQTAFLTVCLMNLALVVGLLLLEEKPAARRTPTPASLTDLLRDREWRIVGLALFIYVAEEMGTASWLEKYAREALGLAHPLTAVYIAVFWLGLGISRTLVGLGLLKLEGKRILVLSVVS